MASTIYGKYAKKNQKVMRLATYSEGKTGSKRTAFVIDDYILDINEASRFYNESFGEKKERTENGIVHLISDVLNQSGESVMEIEHIILVQKKKEK